MSETISEFNINHFLKNIETKAVLSSQSEQGQLLVPQDFSEKIFANINNNNFFHQHAQKMQTNAHEMNIVINNSALDLKTLWAAENEKTQDQKYSLNTKKIPVHSLRTNLMITEEMINDSKTNLEQFFLDYVSNQVLQAELLAFLYGDGKKQPEGILTNKDVHCCKVSLIPDKQEQQIKQDPQLSIDQIFGFLYAMYSQLNKNARSNAIWIMSRPIVTQILNNNRNNSFYYIIINNQQQMSFLGLPVYIGDEMIEEDLAVLANLKMGYLIVERADINLFKNPYSNYPNITLSFVKRIGGAVVDPSCFQIAKLVGD